MAEEGAKTVSARGSFFIGLVLGLGLGCLFALFQHQRFTRDLAKLNADKAIAQQRAAEAKGEAASLREAAPKNK